MEFSSEIFENSGFKLVKNITFDKIYEDDICCYIWQPLNIIASANSVEDAVTIMCESIVAELKFFLCYTPLSDMSIKRLNTLKEYFSF